MTALTAEPRYVVHIAGPRLGPAQVCSRCGQVLVDDRDTAWMGRSRDRTYGPGQPVVRLDAGDLLITAPALSGGLPAGSLPCTTTTPGET